MAIGITGYTTSANDRFSSGFPTSPVENSNAAFIGLGYDWSGFSWSTNTVSSRYKGFAMLSPVHFLTAQHYEYGSEQTQGVRILGQDSVPTSANTQSISNLGYGLLLTNADQTNYDLAIGTLGTAVANPSNMARYAVFDLNNTSGSDTLGNYTGLQIFLTGRSNTTNGSPRIGSTTIDLVANFNSDSKQTAIRTTRTDVQLQVGDSGYGAYHGWTNPNGEKQLVVLGTNSAIDTTNGFNYTSFLGTSGAMAAANSVMTQQGFALRVDGNTSNTWVGSSSTSINNRGAWGLSAPTSAPSDKFVLFNAATAGSNRTVTVDSNHNLRGLYFKATASASDGFTFGGASTLTIGRGGITNYDNSRQVFNSNITLGDHQYWEVGAGGVTANNINTNARLLEIAGSGTTIINGNVSGTGGVALSGTRLELAGNSTYTGATWVHQGRLVVTGNITSSSGVRTGNAGELSGTGRVSTISGSGSVHPGQSPGILTANAVDPSAGLDFFFEFTQTGSPVYNQPAASGNDVLRLINATPFLAAFDAANEINLFFNVASITLGNQFRGGFFTDQNTSFLDLIAGATFNFFVANPSGAIEYDGFFYSIYSGPYAFSVSTISETANFGFGNINGQILQAEVIPEPSALLLILIASAGFLFMRRRGKIRP